MKARNIIFVLVLLLFVGCQSLEQNAYRTVGSVTITVDAAMQVFGAHVRSGKSNAEEQAAVRALYAQYQASMLVAKAAVMKYRETRNEGTLQGGLQAASDSASAVVSAVNLFAKTKLENK